MSTLAPPRSGYADPAPVIYGALAGAMAEREVMWPDEWADRNRFMAKGTSPLDNQYWKTDRAPYLREPMRAWADEELRKLVLVFGSQVGKTEIWANCMLWEMCTAPCWYVIGLPSMDKAKEINERRIHPSILESPGIRQHLARKRDALSLSADEFQNGGLALFVGAGSNVQGKSTPAPRVIVDEVVEMTPEFVKLIKDRGKAYPNAKYGLSSTPGNEGEDIDPELVGCQVFEHSVPCPHCHRFMALTFDLLRWGGEFEVVDEDGVRQTVTKHGSACTADECKATARIACPNCGAECYDYHKPEMLARGVWLAEGESATMARPDAAVAGVVMGECGHVLPADADGEPIVEIHNAQAKRASRGYRINSLYSGLMSWGQFAYDFADTYGFEMDENFVRGYLAQAWAPPGDKPQAEELKSICQASTYRLRTGGQRAGETVRAPLPEGVRLLTVGVDIQKDEAWVHVVGWGAHCRESYLVDFGPVPCREGYKLEDVLGPVLERTYRTVDGRTLRPAMMAVDSGFRTHDVYDFAMANRGRGVFPVKGQSGGVRNMLVSPTLIDAYSDGRKRPHGVQLLNVNTDAYKGMVTGAIKASAAKDDKAQDVEVDGAEAAQAVGMRHRIHLPADCPDTYRSHVTSERRQRKSATKRAAARYASRNPYEWVLLPGRRNEGFDTTVYQFALVDFKQLGTLGRLQMDAMNERLVSPERVAPPLAGLEQRMSRIRAKRGRRI